VSPGPENVRPHVFEGGTCSNVFGDQWFRQTKRPVEEHPNRLDPVISVSIPLMKEMWEPLCAPHISKLLTKKSLQIFSICLANSAD
jgi:hypothetical protein